MSESDRMPCSCGAAFRHGRICLNCQRMLWYACSIKTDFSTSDFSIVRRHYQLDVCRVKQHPSRALTALSVTSVQGIHLCVALVLQGNGETAVAVYVELFKASRFSLCMCVTQTMTFRNALHPGHRARVAVQPGRTTSMWTVFTVLHNW